MCKVSQRRVILINKTLTAESEFEATIKIPFQVDELILGTTFVSNADSKPYVLKTDLVNDEVFAIGSTKVMSTRLNERFTINNTVNGTYKFSFFKADQKAFPITGNIAMKLEFIKY